MDPPSFYDPNRRMFYIPEVLERIILELDKPADLARMARTAQDSHRASIKRLWSGNMSSGSARDIAEHLINLFPSGLVLSNEGSKRFSRGPRAEDWIRFRHYSVYVQSIRIGDSSWHNWSTFPELFSSLDAAFPRLKSLTATWCFIVHHKSWWKMVGPSLRSLKVQNLRGKLKVSGHSLLVKLLQRISVQSPKLETLHLSGWQTPTSSSLTTVDPGRTASTSILALQCLTNIDLYVNDWIPEDIVTAIFQLPLLAQVRLNKIRYSSNHLVEVDLQQLESLELHGTTNAIHLCLINTRPFDQMQNISLSLIDPDAPMLSVHPIIHFYNLEYLALAFLELSGPLPWSQIKPVLECSNITNFQLTVNTTIEDFDEAALVELARSWSSLCDISVLEHGARALGYEPPIALTGLALLVGLCPSLSCIALTMSTQYENWSPSSLEVLEKIEEGTFHTKCNTLALLDVHYTRIAQNGNGSDDDSASLNPKRIAQILHQICPESSPNILEDSWGDVDQSNAWKYVSDFWETIVENEERIQQYIKSERRMEQLESRCSALENECVQLRQAVKILQSLLTKE